MTETSAAGAEPELPTQRMALSFKPPQQTPWGKISAGLDFWRDALAYSAAVLTPVIAYVGNLAFAPLAALIGAGGLVFLGRRSSPSLGAAILLTLLAWALVSMSWSPATPAHPDFYHYKSVEALVGIKLVLELGLYASFAASMRQVRDTVAARASLFLALGFSVLMVLMVVEAIDGAALYQWIKAATHQKTRPDLAFRNVARACYVAVVLFWPVTLRLRRVHLPVFAAIFVGGLGLSVIIFNLDAPILALLLAALVFFGVQRLGRGVIWALIVGSVIYFATAPLVAHIVTGALHPHELPGQIGKQSWAARLDIWRFVSAEILQNPLRGWGLDASRTWPSNIPLHPHDAALQLWLELGAIGPLLVALFWAWLFTRIAATVDEDRNTAAAAAASATAYLTIGALSFGVWQEWWLAVGAVAIVVCGFGAASRRVDGEVGHELMDLQPIV